MHENEIAKLIVESAYKIHVNLGPGLLESAYQVVLAYELEKIDLAVVQEHPVPLHYATVSLKIGYRADLMVENKVIVELN